MNHFQLRIMRAVLALENEGVQPGVTAIRNKINHQDRFMNCSHQVVWRHIAGLVALRYLDVFGVTTETMYWQSTHEGRKAVTFEEL